MDCFYLIRPTKLSARDERASRYPNVWIYIYILMLSVFSLLRWRPEEDGSVRIAFNTGNAKIFVALLKPLWFQGFNCHTRKLCDQIMRIANLVLEKLRNTDLFSINTYQWIGKGRRNMNHTSTIPFCTAANSVFPGVTPWKGQKLDTMRHRLFTKW